MSARLSGETCMEFLAPGFSMRLASGPEEERSVSLPFKYKMILKVEFPLFKLLHSTFLNLSLPSSLASHGSCSSTSRCRVGSSFLSPLFFQEPDAHGRLRHVSISAQVTFGSLFSFKNRNSFIHSANRKHPTRVKAPAGC